MIRIEPIPTLLMRK